MSLTQAACLACSYEADASQYYGPDYELDVRSSNMENANSYEYLEKIKIAVIENLKRTAHAPSVQMQDVPRQSLGMSDDQEAELDDQDEDENKDVRMTQRQWEKRVERQDEYEESDDEDMAAANGVYKPGGGSRQETSYQKVAKEDDTMEIDSGVATPAEPATEAAPDNDDTMIDEALAEVLAEVAQTEAEKQPSTEQPSEGDKAKVDDDGDVDMADTAAAEDKTTEATIKKEEVEDTSVNEAAPNETAAPDNSNVAGNEGEASSPKQPVSDSAEAAAGDAKAAEETPAAAETSTKDASAADKKADDEVTTA